MNKQAIIKQIEEKLNSMNLGWKYQVSDYASSDKQEEEFEKEGKEEVKNVSNELFSLFLDMAESLLPDRFTEEHIMFYIQAPASYGLRKDTPDWYNLAIDQFKEKIEELRGGEK